jgi:hypothetical protein
LGREADSVFEKQALKNNVTFIFNASQVGTEAMKAAIPVGKTFGQWALKNAIRVRVPVRK